MDSSVLSLLIIEINVLDRISQCKLICSVILFLFMHLMRENIFLGVRDIPCNYWAQHSNQQEKKTVIAIKIKWHFYRLILNLINNLSKILTLHHTQFSRTCTKRSMMLKYHHLITDAMIKHDGYCISEIQYQEATEIQIQVCVELSPSLIVIPDLLSILIPPQPSWMKITRLFRIGSLPTSMTQVKDIPRWKSKLIEYFDIKQFIGTCCTLIYRFMM